MNKPTQQKMQCSHFRLNTRSVVCTIEQVSQSVASKSGAARAVGGAEAGECVAPQGTLTVSLYNGTALQELDGTERRHEPVHLQLLHTNTLVVLW